MEKALFLIQTNLFQTFTNEIDSLKQALVANTPSGGDASDVAARKYFRDAIYYVSTTDHPKERNQDKFPTFKHRQHELTVVSSSERSTQLQLEE
jgi:hypothetical protein